MKPFKTYSSISTHKDEMISKFLKKGIQIPEEASESGSSKVHINKKINLNDLVEEIGKRDEAKNLIDDEETNSNQDSDRLPDEHPGRNPNAIEKIFWKIFKIQPSKDLDYKKAKAMRMLAAKCAFMLLLFLQSIFINKFKKEFSEQKISKYFHNGELYNWFTDHINQIYKEHPKYRPVSIEEFKKTSIWERNAAEWREKTKDQILKRLSARVLGIAVLFLCKRLPQPWFLTKIAVSLPVRLLLAYLGVHMILGSLYTIVIEHEGNSLVIGLTLTKYGCELTQPELIVKRKDDNKLVRVDMPKVPLELYLIRQSDLDKYDNLSKKDIEELEKGVNKE